MTLKVNNITVAYGELKILDGVSFSLKPGQWLMIAGPNGAGKSTLINAVSQGVPYTGTVTVGGEDAARMRPRALARRMGVLTQSHSVGYGFTVAEVVRMGRYSYSPGLFSNRAEDELAVKQALEMTGMTPFSNQSVLTLSGGELQRTFLAQLFAQDPEILLLDEPTNHLDIVYQQQVFDLIKNWIGETGRSALSVVHDLSLAKAYGTDALLLDKGRTVDFGSAHKALNRENLEKAYSTDVYAWMKKMLSQWED